MNWKIGQKLVCIEGGVWENGLGVQSGPAKGEICTFDGNARLVGIYIKEYAQIDSDGDRAFYVSKFFRPLESHSAHISEAVRSSLPAIIEEVSDVPAPAVAICGNTNPLLSLITMINTDGTMVAAGGKVPIWVVMK
jgi:hypothetical protein